NAWLHPTAAQSAAAFPHLPVEDEIWGRNGGGQRSEGSYDMVPWANKFVTLCKAVNLHYIKLPQQKPYGGGRSLLQPYTVKRDLSEGYVKDSMRGNELR
ncbi:hypothetical protein HID58_067986, partial [Brassica napus]